MEKNCNFNPAEWDERVEEMIYAQFKVLERYAQWQSDHFEHVWGNYKLIPPSMLFRIQMSMIEILKQSAEECFMQMSDIYFKFLDESKSIDKTASPSDSEDIGCLDIPESSGAAESEKSAEV